MSEILSNNATIPKVSIIIPIWGAEKYLEEVNTGKGIKMSRRLIPYFKYVLPIMTFYVLIRGLI